MFVKFITLCLLLSGCASVTKSHLDDVQKNFSHGNFETVTKDKDIKNENNLDLLIDATALFHENKFSESDAAFEEFNKRNLHETSSSILRETSGLLFGNGVNSYKPYMMDSLFVSYYQIWNLLALQDWSNVRVVINQSYNRQQNMSIEYKKLIEENKDKLSKSSQLQEILDKNQNDWAAFTDIMNPALMYLSGIYFLNDGDFENAEIYLKRANGMMGDNTFIQTDLKLAQQHKKPKNTTWVFYESGFAPRLQEKDFSFYVPKIGLVYFSFSEPYFDQSTPTPSNSQLLADVDKMFMTEYKEYRTNEILRSYTSAISKTAMQATMYNSHNNNASILGVLSSVYTAASSNTDVRTWATLPKNIYVQRIDRTKQNITQNDFIDDDIKLKLKNSDNNLIYIREHNTITDKKFINLK